MAVSIHGVKGITMLELTTYSVIIFQKIDWPSWDMADKLILYLKMPAEHFLLLLRIAANNLQKHKNKDSNESNSSKTHCIKKENS